MVSSGMRGSNEAGKYADPVIWDRDPLEVSVEGLREIIVKTTLLAGKVVTPGLESPHGFSREVSMFSRIRYRRSSRI
jgi:hypothetical protein